MASYPRKTATKTPGIERPGRPAKRNLSRLLLASSPESDYARVPYQSYVPPVEPRPFGSGPYSACVLSAMTDFQPKEYSEYR